MAVAALITAFVTGLIGMRGTAHGDARPRTENRPCPVAVPPGTSCGFLVVPERRDLLRSTMIRVGYAVHRSTVPDRRPDPVVLAYEGPGSASPDVMAILSEMLPNRDIVVVDQRGGRYSQPSVSCPEILRGIVLTLTTPGQTADEASAITKEAASCRTRLQSDPHSALHPDLRGYRTDEIAADLVDLRTALGYARWNLFGVGYSTRPVLQAASADPMGTRSVVLDSFLPAETAVYEADARALRATMTKLGLGPQFDRMVARLNGRPETFDTRDPLTGKRITLMLTGDDVASLVGEAMWDRETLPLVPAVVEGMADGRTDLLYPLLDAAARHLRSVGWGLQQAVQCQDEVPFNTIPTSIPTLIPAANPTSVPAPTPAVIPAQRSQPGHPRLITSVADAAVCATWNLPIGSGEGAISNAPALIIGGQFDAATPPEAARDVVQALPRARFTEFAGTGHGVFLASACARSIIATFLDHPRMAAPCDPGQPAVPLVRTAGLRLTAAGHKAIESPLLLAPLALFLVTAAVQFLAGLVALARRRAGGLPAVAGLAGLAFAALSALSLYGMADPRALAVGLPPALGWYGLLAVISTVLSTGAAFRLRAGAVQIVPALIGLVFLSWLYGWLLA